MKEQILRLATLDHRLEIKDGKLIAGCQTISKEDAYRIASFINNADFSKKEKHLKIGTRLVGDGLEYILVAAEGRWLLASTDKGNTRCGMHLYSRLANLTLTYINKTSNIKVRLMDE